MISKQFKRELLVWSVVYQTMKVDLMNYLSFDEQQIVDAENELTEKMNELSNGPLKTYPSQYLLLYRRYFLDVVHNIIHINILEMFKLYESEMKKGGWNNGELLQACKSDHTTANKKKPIFYIN